MKSRYLIKYSDICEQSVSYFMKFRIVEEEHDSP